MQPSLFHCPVLVIYISTPSLSFQILMNAGQIHAILESVSMELETISAHVKMDGLEKNAILVGGPHVFIQFHH